MQKAELDIHRSVYGVNITSTTSSVRSPGRRRKRILVQALVSEPRLQGEHLFCLLNVEG